MSVNLAAGKRVGYFFFFLFNFFFPFDGDAFSHCQPPTATRAVFQTLIEATTRVFFFTLFFPTQFEEKKKKKKKEKRRRKREQRGPITSSAL